MLKLSKIIHRFGRNEKGSTAILFGLSCIFLFGMIGLSIDTSRFYNYSSRMQAAIDAAALAGAKLLPDESITDAQINEIIMANYKAAMETAGVATAVDIDPVIKIDRDAKSVQMEARAVVPAFFAAIIGAQKDAGILRSTKVVFDSKKIEVSLVLDVTGSMNGNDKLRDMKIAAKDIADELYGTALKDDDVRIAIAPYAAAVNAGNLTDAIADTPLASSCTWNGTRWVCVNNIGAPVDTCLLERQGSNAGTAAAPVGLDRLPRVPAPRYGNYSCPEPTVLPLTNRTEIDKVKSIIDSFRADGSTAGHIGTAWGWYLLSPDWASVFPSENQPEPYSASVDKSVVIMTDGDFNTSYKSGGATPWIIQANESYAQFDALCSGMKAKGINVFTVGFALSNTRALAELKACASRPTNFFDAKTGNELSRAFKDIARQLTHLRVAG